MTLGFTFGGYLKMVAYDRFAKIYDRWLSSGGPVLEAIHEFYVDLLVRTPGVVAELGVGNGRIIVDVAKAGRPCLGVDYSVGMLELCRARAEAAGVAEHITLLQADFRDFQAPAPANLITIPYDSIGHMATTEDKLACFRNIHRNLAPGGRFVFDQQIYTPAVLQLLDQRVRLRDAFVDPETGRHSFVFHAALVDGEAQRYRTFLWLEEEMEDGSLTRRSLGCVENSWLDPGAMRALLLESGFETEACFGSFDRRPYEAVSATHQIWTARRPA